MSSCSDATGPRRGRFVRARDDGNSRDFGEKFPEREALSEDDVDDMEASDDDSVPTDHVEILDLVDSAGKIISFVLPPTAPRLMHIGKLPQKVQTAVQTLISSQPSQPSTWSQTTQAARQVQALCPSVSHLTIDNPMSMSLSQQVGQQSSTIPACSPLGIGPPIPKISQDIIMSTCSGPSQSTMTSTSSTTSQAEMKLSPSTNPSKSCLAILSTLRDRQMLQARRTMGQSVPPTPTSSSTGQVTGTSVCVPICPATTQSAPMTLSSQPAAQQKQ